MKDQNQIPDGESKQDKWNRGLDIFIESVIKPEDPQYFTHTSDDLYDRHHYKIVSNSGETITVDNWEDARVVWWNKKTFLSHVEVITPKKKSKGFR